MEFKIAQPEIEKCFQRAQGFINLKGANPILSHVKITTTKEGIEAFATDYDLGLNAFYMASVGEQGSATLHGKMVYDIVKQLPNDEEVHFRHSGAGRCEIICGKANFKLATIDPDEFPAVPQYQMDRLMKIDAEMFKDMLKKTVYAASQNESRAALNGIFCEFRQSSIRVVATDGHRLAFVSRSVDMPVKEPVSIIIPRRAVAELMKILDEEDGALQASREGNRVFFRKGTLLFFSREVEGSFPNYEQVIPRKNSKTATINVEKARQAVRRMATVAAEKSHLIHLQFKKDRMEIFSEVSEIGEAHEEMEVAYEGEAIKIGINSSFMLDTLGHIESENAVFKMEKTLDAVLVKPTDDDDYVAIIMPMRI